MSGSTFSKTWKNEFDKLVTMSEDPLLTALPEASTSSKSDDVAKFLLSKTSMSAERADALYTAKIEYKSILLEPTSRPEDSRAVKAQKERRRRDVKRKPRPLSAKERRRIGFNEIPKEARSHDLYKRLNILWTGYILEILKNGGHEAKLLKADYHGAHLKVTKCSCPSLVFLEGIVLKETRHTFVISTKKNTIKTIPKRCTVFEFQVEVPALDDAPAELFKWEVFGEHFGYRAAERVGKKFKGRGTVSF